MKLRYILIGDDNKDLQNVDGAPFSERYHISELSGDKIKELFGAEENRILTLGKNTFTKVQEYIHFPIRKSKYGDLFGLGALTLYSGCKVKIQEDWDKVNCISIFKESQITNICPHEPVESYIFEEYTSIAKGWLTKFIDEDQGRDFGLDYETSGIPKNEVAEANPIFYRLQGRGDLCPVGEVNGKTFQITGVSICNNDRISIYYDFLSILNSDKDQEFYDDFYKFCKKHSEDCWTYNSKFEINVTYILFHEFFIFEDAAAVNYIEGRNRGFQSLKLTTQRILKMKSWDDAFDDLTAALNDLIYNQAYQFNWEDSTVIQDGITYVWYESPRFTEIFLPYGEDMVAEAKKLAAKSFANPFLCIPAKILGKYCNVDSYSTLELARYMRSRYSKECIEVFSANLRYKVYLDATGNFVDGLELRRQRDIANKTSNWGMLLTWQFITKWEIKEWEWSHEDIMKDGGKEGSEILNFFINYNLSYSKDPATSLQRMLGACTNWDYEYQVDTNILHEAFPWDYSYEAIYNSIVAWGGLGNLGRRAKRFYRENSWIVVEYGTYDDNTISKVNEIIYYNSLRRRQEWLWYLCRLIPKWDSDVPQYISLETASKKFVSDFKSSDGKPWYDSEEFDEYVKLNNIPTTNEHPHFFISGYINCGAPSGMEYFKNLAINYTDFWATELLISWIKYDDYYLGQQMNDAVWNNDISDYDLFNHLKDIPIVTQRLVINREGRIIESGPVFDDKYTELYEVIDSPAGKVNKAYNCRHLSDDDRSISKHPEYLDVEMMELTEKDYLGYRYLYTNKIKDKMHLMVMSNNWWKREMGGYKDFMEMCIIYLGQWESFTLKYPWDWNAICSTRLDSTGTKLDEARAVVGLFAWRKFRKVISTYLNSLLVEGLNYTKPEYVQESGSMIMSEYKQNDWSDGWDISRGHPNWNCMGVHTKRWSCLTGDTPILMWGDKSLRISELGKHIGEYVTSFDVNEKKFVSGLIVNWACTGHNVPIYKVSFSNCGSIRCTDNHKFLTISDFYLELKHLTVGDAIYRHSCHQLGISMITSIEFDGYEDVYDIEVEDHHNFVVGNELYGIIVHNSGYHTLFGESDTKKIISTPKDKLFFYLDISQAEPRSLAYKTGDPLMKGWYEDGKDIYLELARQFNRDIVENPGFSEEYRAERLKEFRGLYKVLVLAIMYGMGDYNLAEMTGKPLNKARELKRQFLDAMPILEEFIKDRMDYPNKDRQCVKTILGDYLELYPWDESRWRRQGINFCIQEFSALVLVNGFENMVRTAHHDGLIFSPIGTVHDSAQMIMDARFIYNCQAHFDKNYTKYLYDIHGVKYKGDIKLGTNYYSLSKMHIVSENTLSLEGSAESILDIIDHLRNAGINDIKFDKDLSEIKPDYYSSVPKQVIRTMSAGSMSDKSKYKLELTFGDDVINFHRSLVE